MLAHLRMLFLRAGIREGRKRVKLARYAHADESAVMTPCQGLSPTENQISILVSEGLTNNFVPATRYLNEILSVNYGVILYTTPQVRLQ
jgi:hypothetical protein